MLYQRRPIPLSYWCGGGEGENVHLKTHTPQGRVGKKLRMWQNVNLIYLYSPTVFIQIIQLLRYSV